MKNMSKAKNDISDKVMKDIKADKVKMKPKVYFILGSVILGVSLAFLILFTSFFIHLLMYRVRVNTPQAFLGFGRMGLTPFLLNFPWIQLGLVAGGLIIGLYLLKRYDFSYKRNIWVITLVVVTLLVSLTYLIDNFGLERKFVGVKPMGPLYKANSIGKNWVVGEVTQSSGDRVVIKVNGSKEIEVLWDGSTHMMFNELIEVGDELKVVGEWDGETFIAKGIARVGKGRVKGIQKIKPNRLQRENYIHIN
ncbi:hypothetical protein ACFL0F_00700 [Patescibacteria group bacterium]